MTSGHPKVLCLIPGCGRFTTCLEPLPPNTVWLEHPKDPDHRWICGAHWRLVPRYMKRRRSALVREWRALRRCYRVRSFHQLAPGSPERLRWVRLERLIPVSWRLIERAALGDRGSGGMESELKALGLL